MQRQRALLTSSFVDRVLSVVAKFSVLHTIVKAFVPVSMNQDQLSVATIVGRGTRWIPKAVGVSPHSRALARWVVGTYRLARALGCGILHGYVVSRLLFVQFKSRLHGLFA